MTVNKETIAIDEIKLNVLNQVTNAEITVTNLDTPPDITKPAGEVYQYIEIAKKNLENTDISTAGITFKVEKSWLRKQGALKEDILLKRYTTSWVDLKTSILKEDSTYIYYKAITPGFSYFAVVAKAKPITAEINAAAEENLPRNKTIEAEIQLEESIEPPSEEKSANIWRFLYIALGIIGIFLAFLFYELRIHERKR